MVGRLTLALALAVGLLFAGPAGAAILSGPSPYLCFDTATAPAGCGGADSPYKALSFSYFHLETFEDGLLNVPGVSASAGGVTSVVFGPAIHDSVDADDGVIDGSGLAGDSFFNSGGFAGITFSAGVLGSLPTHAGLVWTDGGGTISFSASGPAGLLGPCSVVGFSGAGVPDGSVSGTTAGSLLRLQRSRRDLLHLHLELGRRHRGGPPAVRPARGRAPATASHGGSCARGPDPARRRADRLGGRPPAPPPVDPRSFAHDAHGRRTVVRRPRCSRPERQGGLAPLGGFPYFARLASGSASHFHRVVD